MPSPAPPGGPHDEHPSPGPRSRDEPDPRPQLRPAAAVLLMLEALLLAAVATYSFLGVASGMLSAQIGTALGAFLLLFALAVGLAARSVLTRGQIGRASCRDRGWSWGGAE